MTTEMAVIILKQSKFPKEQAEAIDALLKAVDVHLVGRINELEKELTASRDSRQLSAVPSELSDLLDDLVEYFEPLADADASGDPLEFRGNMEMSLLTRIEHIKRGVAG